MSNKNEPLEVVVGKLMRERKLTLAVAESCTGGLIMHRLTNVAGSSAFLLGGIVAYAYEAKVKLLGVKQDELLRHGAVSEIVASQMARGVRDALAADISLSVTGIAGPGGGTPEKPVGLTYLALNAGTFERVVRRVWDQDREGNKQCSAEAALGLLFDYLTDTGAQSAL